MNIKDKLLKKRIITSLGCWEWSGARNKAGYGQVFFEGKQHGVHRISAIIFLGFDINSSLIICHKCDNPPCFNPKHLSIGTQSINRLDSFNKNRSIQKGTKNAFHKLNNDQVCEIKKDLKNKLTLVNIAKKYGVHFATISAIKCGKTWRYI